MKNKLELLRRQHKESASVHTPSFYRLSNNADRDEITKLLKNIPQLTVFDEIQGQLEELVKLRNPKTVLSKEELQQAALDHLASTPPEEYGTWVYYPWSQRLVHILDENEFVEVRTNRNMYKITPGEKDILSKKKIGIIGLSVGQSIALTMAMERIFGEIRLADFDVLELSNMNRIRAGVHELGVSKVILAAREIAEIDPYVNVTCFTTGIIEENLDDFFFRNGKLDLLVEVCDGLNMKILSRQRAKEHGIPVVMETNDRGMIDVERFDLEPQRPILHGLIDHLDITKIQHLNTNEEKVPFVMAIIGADTVSQRIKISMAQVGKTISGWPQLASSVVLGGGITTDVCRRILLDQYKKSGRYYVDLEELVI